MGARTAHTRADVNFGLTSIAWLLSPMARPSRSLKAIGRTASTTLAALKLRFCAGAKFPVSRAAFHHVRRKCRTASSTLSGRAGCCAPRPNLHGKTTLFRVLAGLGPLSDRGSLPAAKVLPRWSAATAKLMPPFMTPVTPGAAQASSKLICRFGSAGSPCQRNLETRSACSRMTRALSSVSVPVGSPL